MIKHNLTTALRNFRRHWVTTTVNIVGLALGLACFIGALSVVHYFGLDDTDRPGSGRLYFVTQKYVQGNSKRPAMEFRNAPWIVAEQLRSDLPQLEGVARVTATGARPVTVENEPYDVQGSFADPEFLRLFPFRFSAGDSKRALSRPNTAILTESTALRLFGTRNVVGRTRPLRGQQPISIDGVIVLPSKPSHIVSASSEVGFSFEILFSMDTLIAGIEQEGGSQAVANQLRDWGSGLTVTTHVLLPKDGSVSVDTLLARLKAIAEQHSASTSPKILSARPIAEYRAQSLDGLAERATTGLPWATSLMLMATLILLVAALNYANLATAVAAAQRKEFAVRRVLGASLKQLATRQLMDAFLTLCAALVVALLVLILLAPIATKIAGIDLLYAWRHSESLWPQVLGVTLCVSLVASVIPTIVTARSQPAMSLDQSRGGAARNLGVRWLVGSQFFLTAALLVFVFVVHLQQRELLRYAHDTVPYPVIAIRNDIKRSGVELELLRTELLRQPHVESVSVINHMPWGRAYALAALSGSKSSGATDISMMTYSVDHRFFADLGFNLLAGQLFDPSVAGSGSNAQSQPVIILDRTSTRQLGFANPQDAVGQLIYPNAAIRAARPDVALRVVGVVEDRIMQFTTSGASGNAYLHSPNASIPLVRLKQGHTAQGLEEVRAVWRELAPNFHFRGDTINEYIEAYAAEKLPYIRALNGVMILALCVALSGLIGMSMHLAARRRHEIGIRRTLGARTAQLVALLLRDFSRPVAVGTIAAWPLAYVIAQKYLNVYTHRIELTSWPFVASLASVLALSCIALGWQIARTARISPANVLRHE